MPFAYSRYVSHSLLVLLLAALCLNQPAFAGPSQAMLVTLYNGTGSPGGAGQGFMYFTTPFPAEGATQTGNNLNTTPKTSDQAGFFSRTAAMPVLDRQAGYTLRFAVRLNAENHAGSDRDDDGIDDRAGFSVIVLSNDGLGIELGFWPDRIWAQEGGTAEPPDGTLFTQAEHGLWNTTQPATYELVVHDDGYTLRSGGTTILVGKLRDYRAFGFPYTSQNFLFLGDNTRSASANVDFVGPITISSNDVSSPKQQFHLPLLFGA